MAAGHVPDGLGDRGHGHAEAEGDPHVLGLVGDVVVHVSGHAASAADEDLGQEIIDHVVRHGSLTNRIVASKCMT